MAILSMVIAGLAAIASIISAYVADRQLRIAKRELEVLRLQVERMQKRHDPVSQQLLVSELLAYVDLCRAETHALVAVRYWDRPALWKAIADRTNATFGLELLWDTDSPARKENVSFTRAIEAALKELADSPTGDSTLPSCYGELHSQWEKSIGALRDRMKVLGGLEAYKSEIDGAVADAALEPPPPESSDDVREAPNGDCGNA